jgi:hypothetical protein
VEKGARGMGGDFAKSRKEIGVAAAQPISIYMPFISQVGMNCYFFYSIDARDKFMLWELSTKSFLEKSKTAASMA